MSVQLYNADIVLFKSELRFIYSTLLSLQGPDQIRVGYASHKMDISCCILLTLKLKDTVLYNKYPNIIDLCFDEFIEMNRRAICHDTIYISCNYPKHY